MNLQEIKDKFEPKTFGDNEVEILAYKEGQVTPIIGVFYYNEKWIPTSWTETGIPDSLTNNLRLMPKKQHLPKDILCEVWNGDRPEQPHKRYSTGKGDFFDRGCDSFSTKFGFSHSVDNFKVIENPIRPWFNDAECPIPEGLKFRVFTSGGWVFGGKGDNWTWCDAKSPITAYRILGEE